MRSVFVAVALLTAAEVARGGEPAADSAGPQRSRHCLEERFADGLGPYSMVVGFQAEQPASMIPPEDICLDSDVSTCRNFVKIDVARKWFAGTRAGKWVCITDGIATGWTEAASLELGPVPTIHPKDWLGSWKRHYGGASFRVALQPDGKTLHVTGTAEWRASADATPHQGDLDADAVAVGNELRLGEPKCLDYDYNDTHEECYDCVARLMMINGRIFANDNHSCGGMNVNFDGIYDRVPARPRRGH